VSLMNWAGSVSALTVGLGVEAVEVVTGRSPEISPKVFRRLLLTFEDSVRDHPLEVFGETHAERVDTLARLLRGADETDLNQLIVALQEAFARLAAEDEWRTRRRDRRGRTERRHRVRN
jgi:hypothetical protein